MTEKGDSLFLWSKLSNTKPFSSSKRGSEKGKHDRTRHSHAQIEGGRSGRHHRRGVYAPPTLRRCLALWIRSCCRALFPPTGAAFCAVSWAERAWAELLQRREAGVVAYATVGKCGRVPSAVTRVSIRVSGPQSCAAGHTQVTVPFVHTPFTRQRATRPLTYDPRSHLNIE